MGSEEGLGIKTVNLPNFETIFFFFVKEVHLTRGHIETQSKNINSFSHLGGSDLQNITNRKFASNPDIFSCDGWM